MKVSAVLDIAQSLFNFFTPKLKSSNYKSLRLLAVDIDSPLNVVKSPLDYIKTALEASVRLLACNEKLLVLRSNESMKYHRDCLDAIFSLFGGVSEDKTRKRLAIEWGIGRDTAQLTAAGLKLARKYQSAYLDQYNKL